MMLESADLKRSGLKAALPRLRILHVFEQAKARHLSAEDVYRRLLEEDVEIGLATIYRALAQLQHAGLLKQAHVETGRALYELDDGSHHDHLICTECGWIQEFHDDLIGQRSPQIAQQHGFGLLAHAHVLHGRCTKTNCEHRQPPTNR